MGSGSSRRRGAAGPAGRAGQNRDLPGTAPAEGEGAAAAPAPARRAPAAGGSPEPRAGGSCAEAAAGGGAPLQQAALSTRSPPGPENNNIDHQCPENNKKPLGQSTISYDYSEEELMASIEREYCR